MTPLKIKPKFKRKQNSFLKNKLEVVAHGNTALATCVAHENSALPISECPCKGHSTSAYLWYRVRKGILNDKDALFINGDMNESEWIGDDDE